MILRVTFAALIVMSCSAADPVFKAGDNIAIIGDSITEQKQYSRNIEVYVLASSGVPDLDVAQFGWGGETAVGFVKRCNTSLAWFKPTVATTCYGMNDGRYSPYNDTIGADYKSGLGTCVDLLKQLGVRSIVLSAPGAVDSTFYKRYPTAAVYNENLSKLGDLAKALATERGLFFADTHQAMIGPMARAKAAYGENYHVGGPDGVHPDANGHLLMAGSILVGLGCDGEIARITLAADGKAVASAGHSVVTSDLGAVELASTRWPFLLTGDGTSTGSTRSIARHSDFIERLDRFVLVMPGCPWTKSTITWGSTSVVVDGAKLKQGVNLMALFDETPFDTAGAELVTAVRAKQDQETFLVKGLLNIVARPKMIDVDPESKAAFDALVSRQLVLRSEKVAAIRSLLKPVQHRITVSKAE